MQMKCNFECPFYYTITYYFSTAKITHTQCRFHSDRFKDTNPKPEVCDVPEQRQRKMKELLGDYINDRN